MKALIIAKGSWLRNSLVFPHRERRQFILSAQGAQEFSPSRKGNAGGCPTPEESGHLTKRLFRVC